MGAKGFEFVFREEVDPKTIGAELRRLREDSRVSVSDLAERMAWSPQNVLRLERGGGSAAEKRRREPTLSTINLYVRMLGFDLRLVTRPKKAPRKRAGTAVAGDVEPSDATDDEG